MENFKINKYLEDLVFVSNKKIEIKENYLDKSLNSIKLIEILIKTIDRLSFYHLSSLNMLENTIFEFVKKYNDNEIDEEEYIIYLDILKRKFENIENELKGFCIINIYFYGKDNFGLIDNNLLKYNIKKITSEKELKLLLLKNKDSLNYEMYNILLVEENINFKNNFFDEVLNYSNIANDFLALVNTIYINNYDFNYLYNSLNKSYEYNIESIIVGNSYPLVGIEENLLNKKTINLSMHSQDLYYSYKLAKNAILKNKNIKQCIFGISYYVLTHDLSMCESLYSKNMIQNVYYPLLNDLHNSNIKNITKQKGLSEFKIDILIESIFDINAVELYFKRQIYNKNTNYYNDINYVKYNKNFEDNSIEYKEKLGLFRANQHNKMLKYINTEKEYRIILKEFLTFLNENSIEVIFIVFPTSNYYSKNIALEYKYSFDKLLQEIKEDYGIKIIDLRDSIVKFDDKDFIDSDHLNKKGSLKVTSYLNELL